jgi:branched-chain amino acid transport system permease protein
MQEFLQHTLNGLSVGSIYALLALGYTMVYGIFYLSRWLHLGTPSLLNFTIGLLGGMLFAALIGFLVEKLAYKPLRASPKMNVLITAIGVSILFQFGGQIIFGADPKSFPTLIEDKDLFSLFDSPIHLTDLLIYFVSFAALGVLSFIIFKTQTGRAMRAVSTRPDMTPLMGINNNKIISMTFIIGSALAGIAAVLVSIKYPKIDPMMGVRIGMASFVAAVFGGIGSLHGAVIGGFLLGLGETYLIGYGASTYKDAFSFVILIIVLIYKPTGLFGTTRKEKI